MLTLARQRNYIVKTIIPETSEKVTSDALTPSPFARDKALLAELRTRFPILAEPKPLKLGVHKDIRAALGGEVAGVRINRALHQHIATNAYQRALAVGGSRYALDGSVCGEVTEEDQTRAKEVLAGRAALPSVKKKKPKKPKPPPDPANPDAAQAKPPKKKAKAEPKAAPVAAPVETPPPAIGKTGKPILKLKSKAGPVASVTISRKEGKP